MKLPATNLDGTTRTRNVLLVELRLPSDSPMYMESIGVVREEERERGGGISVADTSETHGCFDLLVAHVTEGIRPKLHAGYPRLCASFARALMIYWNGEKEHKRIRA